jgi:hypothetical protein
MQGMKLEQGTVILPIAAVRCPLVIRRGRGLLPKVREGGAALQETVVDLRRLEYISVGIVGFYGMDLSRTMVPRKAKRTARKKQRPRTRTARPALELVIPPFMIPSSLSVSR